MPLLMRVDSKHEPTKVDTMTTKTETSSGAHSKTRVDFLLIADMVEPQARVLDVGCGDGQLLKLLAETRNVDARGMELSQKGVNACVAKGLSVIQGDADVDLADYPDQCFDFVILSQTLLPFPSSTSLG